VLAEQKVEDFKKEMVIVKMEISNFYLENLKY